MQHQATLSLPWKVYANPFEVMSLKPLLPLQQIGLEYACWSRAGADPQGRAKQNQVQCTHIDRLLQTHSCLPFHGTQSTALFGA